MNGTQRATVNLVQFVLHFSVRGGLARNETDKDSSVHLDVHCVRGSMRLPALVNLTKSCQKRDFIPK